MTCLEEDANRLDVSRRYSAIYGRFDSKRPPHKPMNFHEVHPSLLLKKKTNVYFTRPTVVGR